MQQPRAQWLAVDEDRGVLCRFPFGLAIGFMSLHGPLIGVPLGLDSEAEARTMIANLAEDPLIDPTSFRYFQVWPEASVASPEEMEAAGIEPHLTEVFRRYDPAPARDPVLGF